MYLKSIEDIKRGFKSPVASQNLANRVDDKAVKALSETVKNNYTWKHTADAFLNLIEKDN